MELNTEKIYKELERIGETPYWLSRKIGKKPQHIYYWLNNKSIKGAEPIGKALQIEPRDLIK